MDASQEADACRVPDTVCCKTLVGEYTLHCVEDRLRSQGLAVSYSEGSHVFRFGNSEALLMHRVATIPARLGSHHLLIKPAVFPGKGRRTPLLLGKELLRRLGAVMDIGSDVVTFSSLRASMRMDERHKGHYAIPLFDGPESEALQRSASPFRPPTSNEISQRGDRGARGGPCAGTAEEQRAAHLERTQDGSEMMWTLQSRRRQGCRKGGAKSSSRLSRRYT